MGPIAQNIVARLTAALAPDALEVVDDSDDHSGHAGHPGTGESHFTVRITAAAFTGQTRLTRQRLVYSALGDLMAPGGIHALVIEARSPSEA